MDFLERIIQVKEEPEATEDGKKTAAPKQAVNKKAIEVLIKCGGFDNLDKNRPTLLANLDRAFEYVSKIFNGNDYGQASLFGDTDEKEYADYVYDEVEDCPKLEKLRMEKELIGCYVSGHPLDDYKNVFEKVSLSSDNYAMECSFAKAGAQKNKGGTSDWRNRNQGKSYTVLGMISELRTIITKKAHLWLLQNCWIKTVRLTSPSSLQPGKK